MICRGTPCACPGQPHGLPLQMKSIATGNSSARGTWIAVYVLGKVHAMTNEDALIARYIEPNPHRPGLGDARLVDYGVSIWALVGYLAAVHGDVAQTAAAYAVPAEAVEAARAYYDRYKSFIDARIAANDTGSDDLLQATPATASAST